MYVHIHIFMRLFFKRLEWGGETLHEVMWYQAFPFETDLFDPGGSPVGVMANLLVCDILVSEFEIR